MDIINFLLNNNYIALNRDAIKLFGLYEAILLCELCGEYNYWDNTDKLSDGYFYSTIENIEEQTGLSRYQQQNAISKLKELGVIETKIKGVPAKRYIKINLEKLEFVLNGQINMSKRDKLNCPKGTTNNNNYNKNNKNIYKEKYKKESSIPNDRIFGDFFKEICKDPNEKDTDEVF